MVKISTAETFNAAAAEEVELGFFELLDVHATVRKNSLWEGPGPILLVRLETGRIQGSTMGG